MTTEWIEYTGSDEQIAAMMNAKSGVVLRNENLTEYTINLYLMDYELAKFAVTSRFTRSYLICNPHPLADMICQQARTGQPVWIKTTEFNYHDKVNDAYTVEWKSDGNVIFNTTKPDWNMPNAEYSFTPFE